MLGMTRIFLQNLKYTCQLWRTKFRKKPKHGSRFLLNANKTYEFNAWDDVAWDEEQEAEARKKVEGNSEVTLPEAAIVRYDKDANKFWDSFYDIHTNRFFKDRHWLFTEFPELVPKDEEKLVVFEIGCGVGNTVFPLLRCTKNQELQVYCCDFSGNAIKVLKESKEYDESRCKAFVMDATNESWDVPFKENSLDRVVLIFVLSSIDPIKYKNVIRNIHRYLKPEGLVLFRDYGRYDMAQLRFKPGRCLGDNFYVRGDGTRVYFFTQDEIRNMFLEEKFEEVESWVDRRLQVNRGRMLKMYRVWIQCKFRKNI